jgi:hypothetical protein
MVCSFPGEANARGGRRFLENERPGDEGDESDRPVPGLHFADEIHVGLLAVLVM